VTPDELRKLADEAMDSPVEHPSERFLELMFIAPDLARLCAELGEALQNVVTVAWTDKATVEQNLELKQRADAVDAVLAKLSELEAR